jgi:hypothetical protein
MPRVMHISIPQAVAILKLPSARSSVMPDGNTAFRCDSIVVPNLVGTQSDVPQVVLRSRAMIICNYLHRLQFERIYGEIIPLWPVRPRVGEVRRSGRTSTTKPM